MHAAHVQSEAETFERLSNSLRLAAEHAENLAKLPAKGPTYDRFRKELKVVEDQCRIAAYYREDARWFQIGIVMERVHQRGGSWLRAKQPAKLFLGLAEFLRASHASIETLRNTKTGVRGMIVPTERQERRIGAPMQVLLPGGMTQRASGLIVPGVA